MMLFMFPLIVSLLCLSTGFGSGVSLPGLDLGGSGGMKELGGQQSRFKWMMEGHSSPDTSSPENAFHKNGEMFFFVFFSQTDVFVKTGASRDVTWSTTNRTLWSPFTFQVLSPP